MFVVFFRALALYVIIITSVRLMGKRQLGELQPSELVITVLMSNIATLPVEDINIPMIMGIVPIFTLVSIDVILSHISLKFRGVRKIISGTPKIIISDGKIHQQTMKDLRLTVDDLMEALRSQQIFDLEQVQLAVVETTGQISVCPKKQFQPLTGDDFGFKGDGQNPPVMIINDGEISPRALEFIGLDGKWLEQKLRKEKLTPKEVYIMTADDSGKYTIIRKDDLKKK